nr:protein FAR1-related sequence 5-like [Tanacetum cinerariifolium]
MPFVEIVGVTSTGKTFCIAFAFISEEKMDNYKWVLECLKLTLDECMLPRVIITDRDLALMNAGEKVFPNATRLLCRWHISQNILKNCRQTIKVQRDCDSFLSTWKLLKDSPTWISYVENYKQLQLVLRKYPRVLSYVDDNWLNKHKEKFLSACLLRGFVSNKALDMILGELHRLNDLELKYSACSCQLRKSCGLPCACELLAYLNSVEAIPLDSVGLQDVRGDGNCGFRSVAVALGLSEDQWPQIRPDLVLELEANHQHYNLYQVANSFTHYLRICSPSAGALTYVDQTWIHWFCCPFSRSFLREDDLTCFFSPCFPCLNRFKDRTVPPRLLGFRCLVHHLNPKRRKPLIDHHCTTFKKVSFIVTNRAFGIQANRHYHFSRIHQGSCRYQVGRHYHVDGWNDYYTPRSSKAAIVSTFGAGGSRIPMIGSCKMGGLDVSEVAFDAYFRTPFRHPSLKKERKKLKKEGSHAVIITGMDTRSTNPKNIR